MRTLLPSAALLLLSAHATAQPVAVPSDPRAKYEALAVTRKPNGLVEILTRRDGPSGISFSIREIDCRANRFRYLGEGDTREQAERRTKRDTMGPLTEQSISTYISQFACRNAR
ncbi:hypothetical protein J8J14_21150 [Roseomonas sp. SSH11]|uniref:Uncharacterized protein n=1 Tax=Pararoseomonas baculiformis TaxID=2820812 RepID=A0ABS4AJS0_9PROT|nr:hypothetical protein [Pararoseomonas baculiformis]MBP0447283.1 hypothetical protein [Pararoseomonas baculiformis]